MAAVSTAYALYANTRARLVFSGSHIVTRFDLAYLSPVGIACIHPPIPPELGGFVDADASITVAPPAGTYQLCLRELDSNTPHAAAHPHVDFEVSVAPPPPPSPPSPPPPPPPRAPEPPSPPPLYDRDACFLATMLETRHTGSILQRIVADGLYEAGHACAEMRECAVVEEGPYPGRTDVKWYSLKSDDGETVAASQISRRDVQDGGVLPPLPPPPTPPPPPPTPPPPPPTPPPPPSPSPPPPTAPPLRRRRRYRPRRRRRRPRCSSIRSSLRCRLPGGRCWQRRIV